jgi:hypothetical protein
MVQNPAISAALVKAYRKSRAEYEAFGKTNHPEYTKIVNWLTTNDKEDRDDSEPGATYTASN